MGGSYEIHPALSGVDYNSNMVKEDSAMKSKDNFKGNEMK